MLRDWSQRHTLAGGVILDPLPWRPLRDPVQHTLLNAAASAPEQVATIIRSRTAAAGAVELNALARLLPAGHGEVKRAAEALAEAGALRLFGAFAADAEWFAGRVDAAAKAISAELQRHPERTGVPVASVRAGLAGSRRGAAPGVLDAVLAELQRRGFQRAGSAIRPPGHAAALPAGLERAAAAMRAAPRGQPAGAARTWPAHRQPRGPHGARLPDRCRRGGGPQQRRGAGSGRLPPGARCGNRLHLRRHRSGTTSALRTAVGTNRRVIVPLLEQLDRDGITLRVGNERRLAEAPESD